MKIFNCILGVFSLFAAFYCFMYPGLTFVTNICWIISILLCVFGVCCIFEYARKKQNKEYMVNGVMGLVFGIGAVVFSMLLMFNFSTKVYTELAILILFAIWLIYSGIANIWPGIKAIKNKAKSGWWSLILEILTIFAGLFALSHLLLNAWVIGIYLGVSLAMYGVKLIGSVFEKE